MSRTRQRRNVSTQLARLHELDGRAIRITHVNDALPGVRSRFEDLRFASGFPSRSSDFFQDRIEIINEQSNMKVSDIARTKIGMFSISRCKILEQLDLVAAWCLHDCEFDLGSGDSGDLFGQFAGLMSSMRKLESENVAPERQRPFEI